MIVICPRCGEFMFGKSVYNEKVKRELMLWKCYNQFSCFTQFWIGDPDDDELANEALRYVPAKTTFDYS